MKWWEVCKLFYANSKIKYEKGGIEEGPFKSKIIFRTLISDFNFKPNGKALCLRTIEKVQFHGVIRSYSLPFPWVSNMIPPSDCNNPFMHKQAFNYGKCDFMDRNIENVRYGITLERERKFNFVIELINIFPLCCYYVVAIISQENFQKIQKIYEKSTKSSNSKTK